MHELWELRDLWEMQERERRREHRVAPGTMWQRLVAKGQR